MMSEAYRLGKHLRRIIRIYKSIDLFLCSIWLYCKGWFECFILLAQWIFIYQS